MEIFKLNDKIELKLENEGQTVGLIYDIRDGNILISISADDENFKLLRVGENVRASVYNRSEVISFHGKITGRISEESSIYILSELKDFRKIQRRNNIRVEMTKKLLYSDDRSLYDLNIKNENPEDLLKKLRKHLKEGLILDLSAGGLKFTSKKKISLGRRLIFVFQIGDEKMILKGRIVHKDLNLAPKNTLYKYGVEFIDIDEKEEEKIIQFLFVMMRKKRIK